MLTSVLPFVALSVPGTAYAQQAVNTATITAPAGAIETNTSNNSATDSDTIFAAIVATDDSATNINGATGQTAVVNAFTADTINGVAADGTNSVLSLPTGETVPAGLTFNTTTGNVDVAEGTAAGSYSFDYQICEALNPTNCQTATITVDVVAAAIVADPDSVSGINGATGDTGVLDVLDGDTLNGAPATLDDVDITVLSPADPVNPGDPVPALNPATGLIDVPAGTPAGSYEITYRICEELNPTNCSDNTATVVVAASPIVATDDSATNINGATGQTAVVNAFTADTINGVAADGTNSVLSLPTGETVPAGLTFNTTTGNVDVAEGTAAGSYSFDYQICEALNPTNCQTATITVDVVAAAIVADPDSVSGINGATGDTGVLDVLDGDTLNGAPATLDDVDITVLSPADPVNPGDPVPALNPATGLIDVPAGTPAGSYEITYRICEELNPTNCSDNTATVVVAPSIELTITKDNGTTTVTSGETITYSITVSNAGPDAATGAVLTDTPGAGITCPTTNPLAFSGSGIPSGSFTVANLIGGGVTLGTLSEGQSITVTYDCSVN